MAGVTSPLAFPYPTGTDRVMDGDNAIQALAEKVDDYFVGVTGALALTGFVNNGSRLERRGHAALLAISATASSAIVPPFTITTLPAGFRPVADWYGLFMAYEQGKVILASILTTGVVLLQNDMNSGARLYGSVVLPLP